MSIISSLCVLPPDIEFAQIQQTLTSLGWQQQADPTAPPPLIADEPEMAVWLHPATDDRLTYTFHPAMRLRVLMVEGSNAAQDLMQLGEHLPTLTAKDAERLMQSLEIESILLGIAIAEVLQAVDLLDVLAALMEHPDGLIAQEASRVFQCLLTTTATLSVGLLANWQAQHPGYSALFRSVGGCHERRQVLRWLMHDRTASTPAIDATLRTALIDPDWEVRLTALVAAARFNAVGVRNLVDQVALPNSLAEGLDANDRRILQSIKQAAQRLLEGQPLQPLAPTALISREAMQVHIQHCIMGLPVQVHDRVFLLIQSLTQPLPADIPQPPPLPPSIQPADTEAGYILLPLALNLVWVPPIPHWLGDVRNPENAEIRTITPQSGFLISQTRLTGECLQRFITLPDRAAAQSPIDAYCCSWPEAHQHCQALSQQIGLPLRLPTADEWEMAVRGPDGRRFPWGNGIEPKGQQSPSPWGVQGGVDRLSEWTSTPGPEEGYYGCGKLTKFGCAERRSMPSNDPNLGFRVVCCATMG